MNGRLSRQPFLSSVAKISSRLRTSTQSPAFRFLGEFELSSFMELRFSVARLPVINTLLSYISRSGTLLFLWQFRYVRAFLRRVFDDHSFGSKIVRHTLINKTSRIGGKTLMHG